MKNNIPVITIFNTETAKELSKILFSKRIVLDFFCVLFLKQCFFMQAGKLFKILVK